MDTKSKSSKKFSFLLAGAFVAAAAMIFLAFYPAIGRQADYHYSDYLKSDQFLFNMYQANLVLYQQMLDKTGKEDVSYADLYLKTDTENALEWEAAGEEVWTEDETGVELLRNRLNGIMEDILEGWKDEISNGLAQYMDYCVIDNETGEIIKNTGRDIEKIYQNKKENGQEEDHPGKDYVYYVMVTYDLAGIASNISVRDTHSDELLKRAQSAMAAKWLENAFANEAVEILRYQNTLYFYDKTEMFRKLTYQINDRPKDMTFIYALTSEQKEHVMEMSRSRISGITGSMETGQGRISDITNSAIYYQLGVEDIYYEAGAPVYWGILILLGILALASTRFKGYCLHRLSSFQVHLEISITAVCLIFGGFVYFVTGMVDLTDNGFFPELYERYLGFVSEAWYPALTVAVNWGVMFLLFGFWYYLITSFGELFDIGIKKFIGSRSLIVAFLRRAVRGCKRCAEHFKDEVLHVDLGGNTEKTIRKLLAVNFVILCVACTMWMGGYAALIVYTVVVYFGAKKYMNRIQEQYRNLFAATRSIAEGNLQTELDQDWGIFESYKEELSKIQNGFKAAVDKEVRSQRMKTELITNVSHDLKTPLTAITTYIELLENESLTPQERKEYLGVLKKKSVRLKFLIEDLFEVSKASSGNVTLNLVDVDICNLMRQVYLEYEDRVEEAELIFRFHMPEEKVILKLDSQKTCRVFENLYVNIIKYAMPCTRVYVNVEKEEKGVVIELKNMSASELNILPEELTERFVRGDSARNTEGSGLGLAIARSFVELQGGSLAVEIDGDLFKVVIRWT